MSTNAKVLVEEFEDVGLEVVDAKVIDGLLGLCDAYSLTEERLSCLYLTYSQDPPDSLSTLSKFETFLVSKIKSSKKKSKIHDAVSLRRVLEDRGSKERGEEDEAIAAAYGGVSSSSPTSSPLHTLQSPSLSAHGSLPLTKYDSRVNSGMIHIRHGRFPRDFSGFGMDCGPPVLISNLNAPYPHMFERLRETAGILDEVICRMSDILSEKFPNALGNGVEGDISAINTEVFSAFGRVCSDDNDGKFNSHSVVLQGSQDSSYGKTVAVDLSTTEEFALFPGQIIGISATNPHGKRLVVQRVFSDASIGFDRDAKKVSKKDFTLMIASGPFTTQDNLSYCPLKDLLKKTREFKPEILILIGPFVDAKHPLISDDNKENDEDVLSFEAIFAQKVMKPISETLNACPTTRAFLVSSWKDVHHQCVFPAPPFESSKTNDRIHMLSDPCVFSIGGVRFGITSTDVLFHLGKFEISYPRVSGDRIKRLVRHLLQQRSFYPLYPPDEELNIDAEKFECHSKIDIKPDVLILPSDLIHFFKDVDGTLAINPSRLAKGGGGGAYAKIMITGSNGWENTNKNIAAEVVRI